jgi:hypothetical protein
MSMELVETKTLSVINTKLELPGQWVPKPELGNQAETMNTEDTSNLWDDGKS